MTIGNKNKYRFSFVLNIILVLMIFYVLISFSEKIENKFGLRKDLTQNQIYSITETTTEILNRLDKPIKIYTFYENGEEDKTVSEILRRYEQTSAMIQVENVSISEKPLFKSKFEENDVKIEPSSIVISNETDDNYRVILSKDMYEWKFEEEQLYATGMVIEQRLTSSIVSILNGQQNRILFVSGHDEKDMDEVYYLSKSLESDGYIVESCDLLTISDLSSEDCLLFLAPTTDLSQEEFRIISKFSDEGGRMVLLMDPIVDKLENFEKLVEKYGMSMQNNLIVEANSSNYIQSAITIVPSLEKDNPILKTIVEAGAKIAIPHCRSIVHRNTRDVEFYSLLLSSETSYGKVNPYTTTLEREEGDQLGPFILAGVAMNKATQSKMAFVGSSGFVFPIENARYGGNIALFMDSVAWASDKAATIVIPPKQMSNNPLQIDNMATVSRMVVFLILLLPGAIITAGALVWRRRLKR